MNASKLFLAAVALSCAQATLAQSLKLPPSMTQQPQASVADLWTEGEVRKIESGKVLLKHGEIRNLGMSPMAMTFEARDPKVLQGFKVGDKVRFRATYENGKYMLRDIEHMH